MANRPTITSFKANYDYTPNSSDEIELKKDDICYVQQPYENPRGWLVGMNSRSNEHGKFPGTYCEIFKENDPLPLPPRPAKRPTPRAEPKPKFYPINGHMVEKVNFIKPVWCNHCKYYIWGGSRVSLMCSSCSLCAHRGCVNIYNENLCDETANYHEYPITEIFKPVVDWSNEDILEWMIAIHLHPYLHIIRESEIQGRDLKNVDLNVLKSFGISISLHAKYFKISIDELLKPPPDNTTLRTAAVEIVDNEALLTHNSLYEHTFTTQQSCSVCETSMFGVFRQGLMCVVCGLQCHPSCLYTNLPMCPGSYRRAARRPSDSEDPCFCCDFVSPALPPVMTKCAERVEECGLFTSDIYDAYDEYYAPYASCSQLRAAFNQDPEHVNMEDDYWASPLCAAYVFKTFLMELPNPLLDKDLYEDFIKLSESVNYTSNDVMQLLKRQKEHNYVQFEYVATHLIRVSQYSDKNNMTLNKLARIFSVMLVRPPDGKAWTFMKNLDKHKNVLLMILQTLAPNISPVEDLENEPWFYNDPRTAKKRLHGKRDGSYLVRASENRKGQYTLAVIQDSRELLIRILEENNRYGFNKDSIQFRTIKELIEYHQKHPINNQQIVLRLEFPYGNRAVEAIHENNVENEDRIRKLYDEVDQKLKEIKLLEYEKEDKLNLLEECKTLSETQTDIVKFLEDQFQLARQHFDQSIPGDRADIQHSLESLTDVLTHEKEIWAELDDHLLSLQHECNILNTKLNELSPELPSLENEYNRLHLEMQRLDEKKAKASEEEDWKGIYDDPSALRNEKRPVIKTHYTTDYLQEDLPGEDWLFDNLERDDAESMLKNKPSGTFLVRKSTKHPYAISLSYENSVKHVPVLKGPNGYGFAEPHNVYKTLHELVNHYHNQSLRMHNKILDTTLKTPYRLLEQRDSEPIYQ